MLKDEAGRLSKTVLIANVQNKSFICIKCKVNFIDIGKMKAIQGEKFVHIKFLIII